MTELPEPVQFDPANPPDVLPELPDGYVWGLTATADGEVVRLPHAEECLEIHPGEPCPGYPHEDRTS